MEELIQIVLSNYSTFRSWKNDFNSKAWNDANNLHKKLFKTSLTQTKNCGCLEDFYTALHSKHKIDIIMSKSNARFVLKPNKIIQTHGMEIISEHSTEEQFIRLLKNAPSHIVNFERHPSDWEKIVKGTKVKIEKEQPGALLHIEKLNVEEVAEVEPIEVEETNDFESELSELTNPELKAIISGMGLEVPKGNKSVLVAFILENSAK